MPRLTSKSELALVIEVIGEDGKFWHAMCNEWGRILMELRNVPTAYSIRIYEWRLVAPINPHPNDPWGKYPVWKRFSVRPWTLDMNRGDQD